MSEWTFVSEPIDPEPGSMDPVGMARGEPGLPTRFGWRDETYEVAEVFGRDKETGSCSHGSGEQYVRRHQFHIRTTSGDEMKLTFDRQARSKRSRWWIRSIRRTSSEL